MRSETLKAIHNELREKLNQSKEKYDIDWKEEMTIIQMLASDLAKELGHTATVVFKPNE